MKRLIITEKQFSFFENSLVKLDNNVSWVRTYGWVRSDVVSTSK